MTEVDPREMRRAAKAHVAAMKQLHGSIGRVQRTMGTLAGLIERAADSPPDGGGLFKAGDTASKALDAAYCEAVKVFTFFHDGLKDGQ